MESDIQPALRRHMCPSCTCPATKVIPPGRASLIEGTVTVIPPSDFRATGDDPEVFKSQDAGSWYIKIEGPATIEDRPEGPRHIRVTDGQARYEGAISAPDGSTRNDVGRFSLEIPAGDKDLTDRGPSVDADSQPRP